MKNLSAARARPGSRSKHNIRGTVLAVLAAAMTVLSAAPVQAVLVPFSDQTLNWPAPTFFSLPPGGSVTATNLTAGGNPGAYRDVLDVVTNPSSGNSQVFGFHISPNSYNPAGGAISSVIFSIHYNCGATGGPCSSGGGQAFGPALQQGSQFYFAVAGVTGPNKTWNVRPAVTMTAANFTEMTSAGVIVNTSHPNFSTLGLPIHIGFYTANSGGGGYSVEQGYDNWRFDLEVQQQQAPTGQLKICKVAGPGIALGSLFTFNFSPSYPALQVPAGPAPGGYCELGPTPPVNTNLLITETIPSGDSVSSIVVQPPGVTWQAANTAAGTVGVKIGSGVTEVVYTNGGSGWLEICKKAPVSPIPLPSSYTFTVNPNDPNHPPPVTVPAGACSPAIQVPAGQTVIQEAPSQPNIGIVGCTTIPVSQQVGCNTQQSIVNVAAGDLSAQTIAIITNGPIKHFPPNGSSDFLDAEHPARGAR